MLTKHPLRALAAKVKLPWKGIIPAAKLEQYVGRSVSVLGWPITWKEVQTRNGQSMVFVSFEDWTALYEVVFFPDIYKQYCRIVSSKGNGYLLQGLAESEFGAVSLMVRKVSKLYGVQLGDPSTSISTDCKLNDYIP